MPAYFFNVRDDNGDIVDINEMRFADDDAAKRKADESAREMPWLHLRQKLAVYVDRLEVTNGEGSLLASYPLLRSATGDTSWVNSRPLSRRAAQGIFNASLGFRHEPQQQQQNRNPVYCEQCGSHLPA